MKETSFCLIMLSPEISKPCRQSSDATGYPASARDEKQWPGCFPAVPPLSPLALPSQHNLKTEKIRNKKTPSLARELLRHGPEGGNTLPSWRTREALLAQMQSPPLHLQPNAILLAKDTKAY